MTLNEMKNVLGEVLKQLQAVEGGSGDATQNLNRSEKAYISIAVEDLGKNLNDLYRLVDAINDRENRNGEEEARS